MQSRPYNPSRLWQSTAEKSQQAKPIQQPPMVLPKVNSLTGIYKSPSPSIHDERVEKNRIDSLLYWSQVNYRKALYRLLNQ